MSLADAEDLFRSFHGRDAKPGEIVEIDSPGQVDALLVGQVHGISYIRAGTREKFFHKFKASDRPFLFASSDGSQAYILKGGYKFTDRGFID